MSQPPFLSDNALQVLEARYLKRDPETGQVSETPESLFRRVARAVASAESQAEAWEEVFYALMAEGKFLPNSPALMNAERELGMLSACFVLPVEDSIDGIFETLKHAAMIQKAGGGTGFDFSSLRPRGDFVHSSGGKASGPISFLQVFSAATNAIQQGAFRRGANMGILKISHPDIVEFIRAKDDKRVLTNFNLSVALSDDFMNEVEKSPNAIHHVTHPRSGQRYPLAKGDGAKGDRAGGFWKVGELFDLIAEKARESGEPGVVFLDRINLDNVTPALGDIEATNPCSEQPLLPYEACTLGSINLAKFVPRQSPGTAIVAPSAGAFDFAAFKETVRIATRFLDDVVESSRYPVPQTERITKGNRKIGLGVMGFADLLFLLRLPYSSDAAVRLGEEIMKTLNDEAHRASEELAEERGPFPNWKGSRWDVERHRLQRNATVSTVAPTGTLSILAGCSSGIEPLFSLVFTRNILDGRRLLEASPVFLQVAKERGFHSKSLLERIARMGSIQEMQEIPADVRRVFETARDIPPAAHIAMQAAFQKHCDSGISKTINFPSTASVRDIRDLYFRAFREGLKGVTVYRDGSRPDQPMALEAELVPAGQVAPGCGCE
jgi:ribonucleoside-diphosphate reductase alpha chain